MATITITIPDASLTRVINGICDAYNYTAAIEGVQNPPTQAQFAKTVIISFIKTTVKNDEIKIGTAAVTSDADTINIT